MKLFLSFLLLVGFFFSPLLVNAGSFYPVSPAIVSQLNNNLATYSLDYSTGKLNDLVTTLYTVDCVYFPPGSLMLNGQNLTLQWHQQLQQNGVTDINFSMFATGGDNVTNPLIVYQYGDWQMVYNGGGSESGFTVLIWAQQLDGTWQIYTNIYNPGPSNGF